MRRVLEKDGIGYEKKEKKGSDDELLKPQDSSTHELCEASNLTC